MLRNVGTRAAKKWPALQNTQQHRFLDSLFASSEAGRLLMAPTQDSASVINNHIKYLYKITCRRRDKHMPFLSL